jgi:hypothetical protein
LFEDSARSLQSRMSNRLSLLGGAWDQALDSQAAECLKGRSLASSDDYRITMQEPTDSSSLPLSERSKGQDMVDASQAQPERLPPNEEPPPIVVQDIDD